MKPSHAAKKFRLFLGTVLIVSAGLSAAATAEEFIRVGDKPIELETGEGGLIRLDRPAKTVFVANPKIADVQVKSPRLIYLTAGMPGETSIYAVDQNERVILSRRISVSHNLSRLRSALRLLVPDGDIQVQSVNGALVLSGSVRTASDARHARQVASRMVGDNEDDLINALSVTASTQVHIRVRIAEVSRTVLKQFGVNWEGVAKTGNFLFGPVIGRDFINPPLQVGKSFSRVNRTGANSLLAGFETSSGNVNILLDALDEEGLITILAEPNLTAISGKPASFLAGGEFPIIIPDEDGLAVEFKQFGVSLSFTPTIIGDNRVSLNVKPEVSQLSSEGAVEISGFLIPALTTRRAETTVELGSGQSFAIAGLLQNNIRREVSKFPGLADVPILGPLFRSDTFRRNESELVIIVTPYLVRPVSTNRLVAPTDGLTPPTDADRIVHGRTYRPSIGRRPRGPQGRGVAGLVGPAGFVLN